MTDAPSALPIAFTSHSGSGSAQATRLPIDGWPLKRVGESCGISASFAISAVIAVPWPASATAFAGSYQIAAPFSISVEPINFAVLMTPDRGASKWLSESSGSSRRRGCGSKGIAGGPCGAASVIDSMTRTSAMPSA